MTTASLIEPLSFVVNADRTRRIVVIIAWVAIILGVAFRLTQLPTRAVYFDEAYTQMRAAGHTETAMWETLYDGVPRTAQTLRGNATVDANSSPTLLVQSLIAEDSQHPPLFYLAELFVVKVFGNSLLVWRILPALFGILAIGAAYSLTKELFADNRGALISAAVFAVSPIERIYSEQAREYSLLVLLVLLATLAIVRATRRPTPLAWGLYAVVAVCGFYTSPFMGYAIAAHAVFAVFGTGRVHRSNTLAFVAAAGGAIVAYLPWLYVLAAHRSEIAKTNVWSADRWPFPRLAAKWFFNGGSTFFDLEYIDLRWGIVFAAVAVVALIAIFRGFRSATVEGRWCLGAAIAVPAILLVAPDILLGEHRSSVARYGLPTIAMLSIIAARGLVGRPISTVVILGAGLCSSAIGLLHASWWDNDRNADDARIAAIINSVPHAQVVSDIPPGTVVTFARLLNDDVRVSLSGNLAQVRFSPTDPVFVLRPAAADLHKLERRTDVTFIPVPFIPTVTAHEMGTHIGKSDGADAATVDLYQSVTQAGHAR